MSDSGLQLLDLPAMLEAVRHALIPTLGAELMIDLSLPVAGQLQDHLQEPSGPAVIVSLGYGAGPERPAPWLWLDAAFASNLVDRALGGRGQLGIATAAALLSDAECGVLAYLAARTARGFEGLWIRDVYATRDTPPKAQIVWPVSLRFHGGYGIARLGWHASSVNAALPAQIGWLDNLGNEDLRALDIGDVLIDDGVHGLPLSTTTRGLAACGVMRVQGLAETLSVVVDGSVLHGRRGERVKTRPGELFVVLHDLHLPVCDIATLACGGHTVIPAKQTAHVQLRRGEAQIAQGELVQIGSAIGVRILTLNTASALTASE